MKKRPSSLLLSLTAATAALQAPLVSGQVPVPPIGDLVLKFSDGSDSQCRRLFAVEDNTPIDEAGFFCLSIDPNSIQEISATFDTSNSDWQLTETSAWFNTDIDTLDTDKDGIPRVDKYPYQSDKDIDNNDPATTYGFTVNLEEAGFTCGTAAPEGDQILGSAAVQLIRENSDGTTDERDGWADGVIPEDPEADLFTIFNFTLSCVDPLTLVDPTMAPTASTPMPTPVMVATPPPTAFTPQGTPAPVPITPAPVPVTAAPSGAPLLADGAMCDDSTDCLSGACSLQGFCLLSSDQPCTEDDLCATGTCVNGLCGSCEQGQQGPPTILTKELVDTSNVAAQLTAWLQNGFPDAPPPLELNELAVYNQGTNNEAMVAKVDGVCYGIFAPTETQDLFTFGTTSMTSFQQTCQVHERAHSAYFARDRQFWELRLAQCASSCLETNELGLPTAQGGTTPVIANRIVPLPTALDPEACPIVLAGHGLGGGAAQVAALHVLDLEPMLVTFGAPRTVSPDCPLMNRAASRHTRFVNLEFVPAEDTFLFDAVPQLSLGPVNNPSVVHYGTPVFLDESQTIVLEMNDDSTRASIYNNDPNAAVMAPAQLGLYTQRLQLLALESCFPIPAADAWANGHWCDQDDLCASQRCRPFVSLGGAAEVGICAAKGENNDVCEENGDCLSNICNGGLCLGGAPPGPPPGAGPPPGTPGPPPGAGAPGGGIDMNPGPPPGVGPPGTPAPTPPNTGTLGACSICNMDSECQSGICNTFSNIPGAPGDGTARACAETPSGTMSNGCFCFPNDNGSCTDGRCESDAAGTLWLCITPAAACSACDEPSDCQSGNCLNGECGLQSGGPADCSNAGNTQAPMTDFPLVEGGQGASCQMCDTNEECVASNGVGALCMMGRCTLESGKLEDKCPCPPGSAGDAWCESGLCWRNDVIWVCTGKADNGVSCVDDVQCASDFCDGTGVCADPPAP